MFASIILHYNFELEIVFSVVNLQVCKCILITDTVKHIYFANIKFLRFEQNHEIKYTFLVLSIAISLYV